MEELKSIKHDIRNHLNELRKILPKRVDPAVISYKSKIPYKMMDAFASLLWRAFELAENSYQALERNDIAAGILLSRALMKTTSVLYELYSKVEKVVKKKT